MYPPNSKYYKPHGTVSKCIVNVDIDKISLVKPARAKYIIEKPFYTILISITGKSENI